MPDVRDVVNRLSMEDRAIWNEHRTCMRKCYLEAVNATITIHKFEPQDDSFLDLIDIRLALLFDRAGMLPTGLETVTGKEDAAKIEGEIVEAEDKAKVSAATAMMKNDDAWGKGK